MSRVFVDDDYTYKGYRLVIIENDYIKLTVLPEKGADIYKFIDKVHNIDFLWKTPMGLRKNVRTVPSGYGNESNFSNTYEGGWQMIFPNGGSSCEYKGINLEMSGEALNRSWEYRIVENGPDKVVVVFETEIHNLPYKLKRIIEVNSNESLIKIKEVIKNDGLEELNYMWGQHLAFEGTIFRNNDWKLNVPCKKVLTNTTTIAKETMGPAGDRINRFPTNGEFSWPIIKDVNDNDVDMSLIPDKSINSCDIAYLNELTDGFYALVNEREELGFCLSWPKDLFPFVWYYQNFNGSFGYPWYGRANGLVLEPFSGFPALGLKEAVLRKNHKVIQAGEEISATFEAKILYGKSEIEKYK